MLHVVFINRIRRVAKMRRVGAIRPHTNKGTSINTLVRYLGEDGYRELLKGLTRKVKRLSNI